MNEITKSSPTSQSTIELRPPQAIVSDMGPTVPPQAAPMVPSISLEGAGSKPSVHPPPYKAVFAHDNALPTAPPLSKAKLDPL